MTTDPLLIFVMPHKGRVMIGNRESGFFSVTPVRARELARELLVAADEAEGERPSHIYQVQAFTPF